MAGKKKRKSRTRKSAQAPGQFYGYSVQVTRMLARLLECTEGQAVSLEVLDDVAVTGVGGTVVEQSKSGLAHNPVSDRSVDLWKTLFNWVEAIRNGALGDDTKFVLYTAQPHNGTLVGRLNDARTRSDAITLIRSLRNDMWGKAPQRSKKKHLPDSIADFVNGVLEASDEVLCHLIIGFEFRQGSGSPGDDLRPLILAKAISDSAADEVLKYVLGWVKKKVDKLIEQGRTPIIAWSDFNAQLIAAARRFDRSDILSPTPTEISESDIEKELRSRLYIRQLEIIDCEERDLVRAVNDYLRSSVDRTTWSERGDVLESSFEDFSDRLARHWENRRRLAKAELSGRSENEIGQAILARCLDLAIPLQGMEVPSYFTPGSYHVLADALSIGWHPSVR